MGNVITKTYTVERLLFMIPKSRLSFSTETTHYIKQKRCVVTISHVLYDLRFRHKKSTLWRKTFYRLPIILH